MLSKYATFPFFLLFILALVLPSPGVTPAPVQAGKTPYPGAPLCPTHNDTEYHSLWDPIRGCHYDHTHNDDPSLGDAIFGPAGAAWGQNISYPWLTPNENNAMGHTGYKYYVNRAPYPLHAQEGYAFMKLKPNYVTAFRIEYHDVGGNAHLVKRFHSYYMEVQVQSRDLSITGTVSFGGWADFGCLNVPYKKGLVRLPALDPQNPDGSDACGSTQKVGKPPYRAATTLQDMEKIQTLLSKGRDSNNRWIWTSSDRYGYNQLGYFFFRTLDSWTSLDRNDPYAEHFICPDLQCKFNNSEHHVFNVFIKVPASLDLDGDGIVNYEGYTDIQGNIVSGCSAPSASCVPLKIVNAPVGIAVWSRNLSGPRPKGEIIRDHDLSPAGEHWIVFPGQSPMTVP